MRRRWLCRRCCVPRGGWSASVVPGGSAMSRRSRPRGRNGRGLSALNCRPPGAGSRPTARYAFRRSGSWSTRRLSGCSTCSVGRCRPPRTPPGSAAASRVTARWRSCCVSRPIRWSRCCVPRGAGSVVRTTASRYARRERWPRILGWTGKRRGDKAMSNLANQLVAAEREEVARGVRILLANPLITERGAPRAFDLVRRRRDPIAGWFEYYCGWPLVVEPRQGYARLAKVRADRQSLTNHTRPARRLRSGRAPFDRRRYTLLCVVAAELLSGPMTTIGLLADRVMQATKTDPGLGVFDPTRRPERMAYVDVLRLLESHGAIECVDGATEAYVESSEAELLAELVRERRYGGSGDDRGGAEEPPLSEVQRNLWLRHTVFRRIFDDPVVYRDDLTEAQLAYLASPTGRQLLRRAAEQSGFELEERAEGFLLVDVDALATDGRFPDDSGNAKVAALMLLDVITAAPGGIALEQLCNEATAVLDRAPRWAMAYRSDDGADRLVSDATAVLAQFGLVRRAGGLVFALPAAARYTVATMTTTDDPDSEG